MKKFYEAPEFEYVVFETEEQVTASGEYGDNDFNIEDTDWT